MRTAFITSLMELADQDPRVWLVCGDLGYSVLEGFAAKFPQRYLNAGVAEQNMMGMAAGLAMSGKVVFTYSIANFPVMRCLEQIRNDVCYHNLNVRIVAVGGGLAYGPAGYTHHGVEDLAVMRVLPHMTVIAPADPIETRLAVRALADWRGPCYLRLGKAGEPCVHQAEPVFRIGQAIRMRDGGDLTLISTGGALRLTLRAADQLHEKGCHAEVLSMPTVHPVDEAMVVSAARRTRRIVTVEEHGLGGLAAAVADALASGGVAARMAACRLVREPLGIAGNQESLGSRMGLSVDRVVEAATSLL